LRNLGIREAIGLQVGEAPVRLPEPGPRGGGCPIGFDGLGGPSQRLQRMPDRKVQLGIVGRLRQELQVERQRRRVIAEAGAHRRMRGAVGAVVGIHGEQLLDFLARTHVLMTLQQHDRIVVARLAVLRRHLEDVLQEKFGVVGHVELHADLGEQPHALDVIAMGQQIAAHHPFRIENLAVGIHAEGRDDLGRQGGEIRELARSVAGVARTPLDAVERLEGAPARG
jgi:hypothetical protein